MKIDKTNVKTPLTKSELDLLIRKQMPNDRLDRIRDVFVFCCLAGLAFTDADHLRREHLSTDEQGTQWIHKPREKTAVMSQIPLLPYRIKLLDKYANDPELQVKGKLLPVPSNQKMNSYIKEIAAICNIGKNLTTHVARHSWATAAQKHNIPISVISAGMGHASERTTQIYMAALENSENRHC